MHIGIISPITLAEFDDFLDATDRHESKKIVGMKAPAVDAVAKRFLEKGHTVSIYTLDPSVKQTKVLCGKNLTIFIGPYRKSALRRVVDLFHAEIQALRRMVASSSERPDVLHAHWTYEFAQGGCGHHIPLVVTVRDWAPRILRLYPNFYRLVRFFMDRSIFKRLDIHFVANSPYIAGKIENRWKRQVPVIPNPVDDQFLLQQGKRLEPENRTLITISNAIGKGKNLHALLMAFQLVRRKFPTSELWMVGSPFTPECRPCQSFAREGLLDGVRLCGKIDHHELPLYLDQGSLLIHPSIEESFGNTLIEAMARRVPVIGGKSAGAVPFLLDYGKAGSLCDVTSPVEMAKAVTVLWENEDEWKRLSVAGFNRVKDCFSVEAVAEATLELYRQVMHDEKIIP